MDMYKIAFQKKFRFGTVRGMLTVEDLFDLPLTSKNGVSLQAVAQKINATIKSVDEEDFVGEKSTTADSMQILKLDIVKDVIATRKQINRDLIDAKSKAAQKEKIMSLITEKKDDKLKSLDLEDLEKQLAEL